MEVGARATPPTVRSRVGEGGLGAEGERVSREKAQPLSLK